MSRMLSSIACISLILATAQAFPTLKVGNATGIIFSIKQKPLFTGFATYGSTTTSGSTAQNGSVAANPANPFKDESFPDAIFVETLKIGTPPRNINLQMDTGSWQL